MLIDKPLKSANIEETNVTKAQFIGSAKASKKQRNNKVSVANLQ